MDTYCIVTNNPAVETAFGRHEFSWEYELNWQNDYLQVLLTARDGIHQGKRLLIHPESGSVAPGTTPYRSLLLSNRLSLLDMRSLEMIENTLTRFYRFVDAGRLARWPEAVHLDFQMIDLVLLRQAVSANNRDSVFFLNE